ncbi:MAG: Helix-turn-helix domain protein [Chitinophagaceae bacterium]|nr:Helix-turn-helix domain protein [Chitinophagaceae bacterium]
MNGRKQRLLLQQADRKLEAFRQAAFVEIPANGWIHTIRQALNISLGQMGRKLKMTAQGIKALETREKNAAITLQSLHEIAEAMDLKLVYAIVPKEGTLEDMINQKAHEKAIEIVNRTSVSMQLENQGNSSARLRQAVEEKQRELQNEMPKFLWD